MPGMQLLLLAGSQIVYACLQLASKIQSMQMHVHASNSHCQESSQSELQSHPCRQHGNMQGPAWALNAGSARQISDAVAAAEGDRLSCVTQGRKVKPDSEDWQWQEQQK